MSNRPPEAICCDYCAENPLRSKHDTKGEQYYCPHREGGTVSIRTGRAWVVRFGVGAEEYRKATEVLDDAWEMALRQLRPE